MTGDFGLLGEVNEEVIVGDMYEVGDVIDIVGSDYYLTSEDMNNAVGIRLYGYADGLGQNFDVPSFGDGYYGKIYNLATDVEALKTIYLPIGTERVFAGAYVDVRGCIYKDENGNEMTASFSTALQRYGVGSRFNSYDHPYDDDYFSHRIKTFSFLYPLS